MSYFNYSFFKMALGFIVLILLGVITLALTKNVDLLQLP